jgi:hypothetical protein
MDSSSQPKSPEQSLRERSVDLAKRVAIVGIVVLSVVNFGADVIGLSNGTLGTP